MIKARKRERVMEKLLENAQLGAQERIALLVTELESLTWGEVYILTQAVERMLKKFTET